jgi:hypothetical protein
VTISPIAKGTTNWDVPLEANVQDLQNQQTAHAGAADPHGDRADAASKYVPRTGGGILYVDAGALKYRGSSGTVTTIAPA